MKLLHLDSSIQGDASTSRPISAAIVETLRAADPSIEVTYRDLGENPLPHLTLPGFGAAESQEALEEFLGSDIVVIGAGFYNFTIPTQLKSWVDRILIAGKTFGYSEAGPVGLAGGKRVVVALARGGIYSGESPFAAAEHGETLLRTIFGFIGITDLEFVVAEGTRISEDLQKAALAGAMAQAGAIAAPQATA